jgi:hypothetical protein
VRMFSIKILHSCKKVAVCNLGRCERGTFSSSIWEIN